ncbi:hypothetical protein AK812_SmicGene13037 [Symbiodinium microadriaticum]|uniref:Uncharacterized protein n=1 Tax=Symbiodinium microadriaticum TaxID=2951 RepID=A0A1Q9E937_SYMMI|nr:hypothetical protein AK812_SmicGene13037 [Symbiodinium microadriaticum]
MTVVVVVVVAVVVVVVAVVDPDVSDPGETVTSKVCRKHDAGRLRLLLGDAADQDSATPLFVTAQHGHLEVVQLCLHCPSKEAHLDKAPKAAPRLGIRASFTKCVDFRIEECCKAERPKWFDTEIETANRRSAAPSAERLTCKTESGHYATRSTAQWAMTLRNHLGQFASRARAFSNKLDEDLEAACSEMSSSAHTSPSTTEKITLVHVSLGPARTPAQEQEIFRIAAAGLGLKVFGSVADTSYQASSTRVTSGLCNRG